MKAPRLPVVLLAALATLLGAPVEGAPGARLAHAGDAPAFKFERAIAVGKVRGPQRLEVDVPLLTRADPGRGLADLRLFDAGDREVGYLLVAPSSAAPTWREAQVAAAPETRDESGLEADLGEALRVDRVRFAGLRAPLVKRVRVEGSSDRQHWVTLAADETVFDLPDDGLERTEVAFAPGVYRYLHATWDDHASSRVAGARVLVRLQKDVVSAAPLQVGLSFERRASEPRTSRFRVRFPGTQLPITAIELECGGGALLRPAKVLEPRLVGSEVTPAVVGSGTLRRAVHDGLVASSLRIPIQPLTGADLDLVVDDGDNPPLPVTAVRAIFEPQPWIYFEAPPDGPIQARFGNPKLLAPRYDLEAMRSVAGAHPVALATWGDVRPAGAVAAPSVQDFPLEGGELDPAGFLYRRRITTGKRGLTALLLDPAVLAHARGLEDLRILDPAGHQVPYLVEKRDEPLSLELPLAPEPPRASGAVAGESRYRVGLPYPSLPPSRLLVSSPIHVFERSIRLEVDNPEPLAPREPATRSLGEQRWSHGDPETVAPPLSFSLPTLGADHVVLDVSEGDNHPLEVSHAELLLPASRLRFFRATDGDLTLLYGRSDLGAPRYDLALLAPRLVGMIAQEVTLEPETAALLPPAPSSAPKRIFWASLGVAVVVLLALIGRLVSKPDVV